MAPVDPAAWLRMHRARLDQTQPTAAAHVGVGVATWARWESGRDLGHMRIDVIDRIASWSGLPVGDVAEVFVPRPAVAP